MLLAAPQAARGQHAAPASDPISRVAVAAVGSIQGLVQDDHGVPVSGALVSALGATSAFGKTDRVGRFELVSLSPGPYLLRAHLAGFAASRGQIVEVRASGRTSSSISLRRPATSSSPSTAVLGASVGVQEPTEFFPIPAPTPEQPVDPPPVRSDDDHGEIAWRLRHLRRSVLQDAAVSAGLLGDSSRPPDADFLGSGSGTVFARAVETSARAATDFFSATSFSGQLNLLTTSLFDNPQQLFSGDSLPRSIAYVSVGAPVGSNADWSVRGAFGQADMSSWVVAGAYATRGPARHHYDFGLSYATQRYETGSPAALRDMTDSSRNAGAVFGFDTFMVSPMIAVTYGARYAHYDYLDGQSLLSPRLAVTFSPVNRLRLSALASSRSIAPGAEEFMPPGDNGIWLPPQRTFSSLLPSRSLNAEQTNHVEFQIERDLGAMSTISVRAFEQRVNGQLVTMFGVDVPGQPPADFGHYFVGNYGDVAARGVRAGFRTAIASRVHGSVEYSLIAAAWNPGEDLDYWTQRLPATASLRAGRIHDVATTVEADVPETSTRVVVFYRVSNAFAGRRPDDNALLNSRFNLQVHQSLPFMDFSTAKWEMLISVCNVFHEAAGDQSVYDELLVVRPPKRIVGGLAMRF